MMKEERSKIRYCVQWNAHERYMCRALCSLMEHQSLVDLAICCGNNTIHAHKCILAANSSYFREQLERNSSAEQVIINGLDFVVMKSIVEFIYCGETNVSDENMKYMIAAAKAFQIRGLQALVTKGAEFSNCSSGDQIYVPPPMFVSKKPKYPTAFRPISFLPNANRTSPTANDQLERKLRRKYMRSEAEIACAKEAAASRQALEALQKELAVEPQVSSFVVEESCTETTVENFVPHVEGRFVGDDLGGTDKIKQILGGDITGNVEIMFKTSDGNFVSVTDEVLQNIAKGALQYQVIDENGLAGEIRELRVLDNPPGNAAPQDQPENPIGGSPGASVDADPCFGVPEAKGEVPSRGYGLEELGGADALGCPIDLTNEEEGEEAKQKLVDDGGFDDVLPLMGFSPRMTRSASKALNFFADEGSDRAKRSRKTK